jgi:hypothetical protein
LSAQVYNWVDTFGRTRALDLFWVRSGTTPVAVQNAVPRIQREFQRLLSQELTPAELVTGGAKRSTFSDRPSPPIATEVNVDNRVSQNQSVIEVTTKDQSGLLFWLSHALQLLGLEISLAKINTEGNQVADVFYVTDGQGAGFGPTAAIGFSAMVVIAAVNALTFLWLWYVRATPLALGMALSWSGQAGLSFWWELRSAPSFMALHGNEVALFVLISLYVVGGGLHIAVVQRSMEIGRQVLLWPAITVIGAAIAAAMMF